MTTKQPDERVNQPPEAARHEVASEGFSGMVPGAVRPDDDEPNRPDFYAEFDTPHEQGGAVRDGELIPDTRDLEAEGRPGEDKGFSRE